MCKRVSQWRGTIGSAAILSVCFGLNSCDDTSAPASAGISDLEVQVVDGYLSANLQPVVPPDPILCQLTLRLTNTNSTNPLTGLSVPSAAVLLADTSDELGIIRFETDWDGAIDAGAVDTVVVTKIAEDREIFQPPCGDSVYLRVRVVKTAVQFKQIKSPSYRFGCPVNAGWEGDRFAAPGGDRDGAGRRANE